MKYWGSVENFDLFVQKIKDDELEAAKLAIKQFGSVEKYTESMKYNLEHFSEIMEQHPDLIGNDYSNVIINSYSSDYIKAITDKNYGSGAADYIVKAFQYYADHEHGKI